jgi:hypothetical protein
VVGLPRGWSPNEPQSDLALIAGNPIMKAGLAADPFVSFVMPGEIARSWGSRGIVPTRPGLPGVCQNSPPRIPPAGAPGVGGVFSVFSCRAEREREQRMGVLLFLSCRATMAGRLGDYSPAPCDTANRKMRHYREKSLAQGFEQPIVGVFQGSLPVGPECSRRSVPPCPPFRPVLRR